MTDSIQKAPFEGTVLTVSAPSRQWMTPDGRIDLALHEKACRAAEDLGFRLRLLEGTLLETARFAGPDRIRARDLVEALTFEGTDLYMPLRGGYGAMRVLMELTDEEWRRLEAASLPAVVGYSDFTAIEWALMTRFGRMSWQGPTLRDLIDPAPETVRGLEMVLGRRPFEVAFRAEARSRHLGDGVHEGVMLGGNLSLVMSLVPTPWAPPGPWEVLFLEDVGESAYAVERCLGTLVASGRIDRNTVVLLGDFKGVDRACAWEGDFSMAHVLETLDKWGIRWVTGLPFGHMHAKCSLPVGARVRVAVDETDVRITFAGEGR